MRDRRARAGRLVSIAALSCALALPLGCAGPSAFAEPQPRPGAPASPAPTPSPAPAAAPSAADAQRAAAAVAAADAAQQALDRQLEESQRELDRVVRVAESATERYNQARVLLARRNAAVQKARAAEAEASRRSADARLQVYQLAASLYMQGGSMDGFEALLGLGGAGDIARKTADLEAVSGYRATTLEAAAAQAARAATARRAAAQAQVQQQAAAARAEQAFAAATKAAGEATVEQAAVQRRRDAAIAELARLRRTSVAVERARLDAAVERAQRQRHAAAGGGPAADEKPPPARTSQAAKAIQYAAAQIGKPYRWAAEGPDSFDCSGLTMRAWERGGRKLVHYSGEQYRQTSRIPIAALQPGDLVFYGSSPENTHHVGLFIGDGRMIEAPYTGAFVRVSSIYRADLLPYGGRP